MYWDGTAAEGLSIGKGRLCRIYNKVRQCQSDPVKWAVLLALRYNGEPPECAVRVEFQLRRDDLRDSFGINTVEELFAKLPGIAEFLTHEWLRFSDEALDRENNHQSRGSDAPHWQAVQGALAASFGSAVEPLQRPVPKLPEHRALSQQAWGCFKSYLAIRKQLPADAGELIAMFEDWLMKTIDRDWYQQIQQRHSEFDARRPLMVDPADSPELGEQRRAA